MRNTWTLTKFRMRLALRNRAFMFFSLIMPLAFLFVYATLFGRSDPGTVQVLLPAVLGLTVMGSFWGLSIQLVMFREQGILRRFRLAPVDAFSMLVSSVISNYILTLPTIVVELLLAKWIWKVPGFGNLAGVFLFISLGIITFASFGLIVASITSSIQETQMINNAIWFLFLFFSGATFPLVLFPDWLQRMSVFLPATHLIVGLLFTLVGSVALSVVIPEIVALAGGSAMALYVSTRLFRWEPEERISRQAKFAAAAVVIPFLLLGVWENSRDARRTQLRAIYENATKRGGPVTPPPPQTRPSPETPAPNP